MIPRIAKAGRSFKGAAQYYLHDKQARTSERVAFVEVMNMPDGCAANPARAVADMVDVFAHAGELKKAAGLKAGRKLQNPVYSYSLAWHPTETPTRAEQMDAARASIEALGLSDRQALIVAHSDTNHPHVHVILNRVCPSTGRAASTSNDQLKLQEWALKYERDRGHIFCDQRVKNAEERNAGNWKKAENENRSTAMAWKKAENARLWAEYREQRDAARTDRKPLIDALWQQRGERFGHRRSEIQRSFKPLWRDLFKKQKRHLAHFDNNLFVRVFFALKQSERRGIMPTVEAMFKGNTKLRDEILQQQEQERTALGAQHKRTVTDAAKETTKAWKYDRDQLAQSFKDEDAARLKAYKQQGNDLWQQKAETEPNKARETFEETRDRRKNDRTADPAEPRPVRKRKRRQRGRGRDDGGRDFSPD